MNRKLSPLCCVWLSVGMLGCGGTAGPVQAQDPSSETSGRVDVPDSPPSTSDGTSFGGDTGSSGELEPSWAFDVNHVPDAGDAVCDAFELDARPRPVPTDLLMVVDGSGSMVEEAAAVEARLNGLITGLVQEGVDTHVVLLGRASGSTGICIGPPAGSGQCPDDSNDPEFRHVDVDVGSWEPLRALVDLYPEYADVLRPGSRRQLVVVSDDNSFALSADDFELQFEALDPWNQRFVFHAVVSETGCPQTVSLGVEYLALARRTGGSVWDLCGQNFDASFEGLGVQTSEAAHSCAYPLGEIDRWPAESGNVVVSLGGMNVGPVESSQACQPFEHGWFIDDLGDEPTLQLCPASCAPTLDADPARLDVSVLCDEVPA